MARECTSCSFKLKWRVGALASLISISQPWMGPTRLLLLVEGVIKGEWFSLPASRFVLSEVGHIHTVKNEKKKRQFREKKKNITSNILKKQLQSFEIRRSGEEISLKQQTAWKVSHLGWWPISVEIIAGRCCQCQLYTVLYINLQQRCLQTS